MAAKTLKKYFPILEWLPKYSKKFLKRDSLAGLTVLALIVPQSMAYAQIAGLSPEFAFFTIPFALLGYAIFGTSRHNIISPTSSIAIMSAAIIGPMAMADPAKFIPLTIGLALLSGLILVVAGIARLGFLSKFFSKSVITGFITGLSLVIIIRQIPKLFGFSIDSGDFFQRLWELVVEIGDLNLWSTIVGITSLILLILLKKFAPKIPAALIALIYSILLVTIFSISDKIAVVGEIPARLPPFGLPDLKITDYIALFPGALAIVVVGFAETVGIGRIFASKHRYDIDPNQELIGLGASNIGAGLFSGFAVDASLSKTAANDRAGAKTQMSGIFSAVLVILTALFLTPLFHNLAEATLAAIVVVAVWPLVNIKEFTRFYKINRPEFWVAVVAMIGVLIFDILLGLIMAVVLSLLILIYKQSRPHFAILGKDPKRYVYGDISVHPTFKQINGLLIIRMDAPLFFGNAIYLKNQVKKIIKNSKTKINVVIIDMEATGELDISAIDVLKELDTDVHELGSEVWLARVHSPVRRIIQKSRLKKIFLPKETYMNVEEAVNKYKKL
ncbi:sulfate permease, partial [Patescibacteria group bacterium]|nr:sulfate permease [Patescibacteria group bacterium]